MTDETVVLTTKQVHPLSTEDETFLVFPGDAGPVSYFVGRNGSGKSRAGHALVKALGGRYLSTDRLLGLMNPTNYTWGAAPGKYTGPPLEDARALIERQSRELGIGTEMLLTLRDRPEVGLKVAAFMRTTLGRSIEFRENAGFFDPFVRTGGYEYSLLRDEGHGLRELTILLAAAYLTEWNVLVVDEPELHLHPSLARLWLAELSRECVRRGVRAVIITHEPSLLRPTSVDDLESVWHFRVGANASTVRSHIPVGAEARVTAALQENPHLLGQLAFAPRPVLVEGPHDVAALTAAMHRTKHPAVVAQTELVPCGSSGAVATWFEIGKSMGLDLKAVADLDAVFSADVQRTFDRTPDLERAYREELLAEPPAAHVALRPLIEAANKASIEPNERARARWLADLTGSSDGLVNRRDKLLGVWRDQGLWLHPQGTLEDVLGIEKGRGEPRAAASQPGPIDEVVDWFAYDLDPLGELGWLIQGTLERIANALTQAQGLDPEVVLHSPVGPSARSDARLVDVESLGNGRYKISMKAPTEFVGFYVEVDRDTAPSDIRLRWPDGNVVYP